MSGGFVCVGGHDLDHEFRSVRLLSKTGANWPKGIEYAVGDIWNVKYRSQLCDPPHLEDVCVERARRVGAEPNLNALVPAHVSPWSGGPDQLFDGTIRGTPSGTAYIPSRGRLPTCSTGYWTPSKDLNRSIEDEKVRILWPGASPIRRFSWVGVAPAPEHIPAGSLVRVSLSRVFRRTGAPEGYYVQISGVL